ncbi:hypothetical protein J6590_011043 [Homalodisca vitripennis]|nr:hypothetical protein J6590_011043 [Homalodisca vitripennis]
MAVSSEQWEMWLSDAEHVVAGHSARPRTWPWPGRCCHILFWDFPLMFTLHLHPGLTHDASRVYIISDGK